ncbi:MAG: hypothetical protein ACK421_04225 [Pseudanabaenaceae cyanobacterium]
MAELSPIPQQKNYTVVINGYADIPYQEAKTKIAKKEWDIAFAYSPMLSIVSGFRMFPNRELYYSAAIFVRWG